MTPMLISIALFFIVPAAADAQTAPTTASAVLSAAATRAATIIVMTLDQAWEFHAQIKADDQDTRERLEALAEQKNQVLLQQLKTLGGASAAQHELRKRAIVLQQEAVRLLERFKLMRVVPDPKNPRLQRLSVARFELYERLERTLYGVNSLVEAIPEPDQ